MNDMARPNLLSETIADPIRPRPTYSVDLGGCGTMRLHCANMVMAGTVGDDDGAKIVSIVIGQTGGKCGCKVPGRAFEFQPTPDQARMLAGQLVDAADAVDAHATKQATAALSRICRTCGK